MAKAGGYCPVCLYPGQLAEACKNATKPKYVCSMKGCQKHPHPSLHGPKDKYVTSINILVATSECGNGAKDTSVGRGLTSATKVEPNVEHILIKVNFMKDVNSEIDNTFVKKEVNKRVRELDEGKKALLKQRIEGERVLMVIQMVPMKHGIAGGIAQAITFFDTGATCSVVRIQFAEDHKLYGEKIVITLTTVNGTTDVTTKLYLVELMDRNGDRKIVKAFGLDSITGKLPTINYGTLKNEFSPQVQEKWASPVRLSTRHGASH